jgi:hypothetical protein
MPDDNSAPPFSHNDIVVPNTNFNVEIHNEDFHYTHLMAGFLSLKSDSINLLNLLTKKKKKKINPIIS